MEDNESTGGGFIAGVIIAAVIYFIFLRGGGKYEGQNAEYWFNTYDSELEQHQQLKDCVETYYNNPKDLYYNCM